MEVIEEIKNVVDKLDEIDVFNNIYVKALYLAILIAFLWLLLVYLMICVPIMSIVIIDCIAFIMLYIIALDILR